MKKKGWHFQKASEDAEEEQYDGNMSQVTPKRTLYKSKVRQAEEGGVCHHRLAQTPQQHRLDIGTEEADRCQ